jgi:hypothetical protein
MIECEEPDASVKAALLRELAVQRAEWEKNHLERNPEQTAVERLKWKLGRLTEEEWNQFRFCGFPERLQ